MKLIIKGTLPGLNEYTKANRTNKYTGNKMKKEWTEYVYWCCKKQKLKKTKELVYLGFTWYCENKRRDPDNIVFAKKFILDGLELAGVISKDGWKNISGWSEEWYIDKENPRIEVEFRTGMESEWQH